MAKCIKHTKTKIIKRVSNKKAAELIEKGNYKYCSKTEYRNQEIK